MKKPLASVLAALCVLTSLPALAILPDDVSAIPSAVSVEDLKAEQYKFDTQHQVATKTLANGRTIAFYLQADGSWSSKPPSKVQTTDPKRVKLAKDQVPGVKAGDEHVIKGDGKKDEGLLHDITHNMGTWAIGGALIGGMIGAAAFGPAGFLVFGLVGLLAGVVGHMQFIGDGKKKK